MEYKDLTPEELEKRKLEEKSINIFNIKQSPTLKKTEEKCIWSKQDKKKKKKMKEIQKNNLNKNLQCSKIMGKLGNVMKGNISLD